MSEKRNVRFIRKNGRIIPIRMTNQQKDIAVGSAAVGAGGAIGFAAGKLSKFLERKSSEAASRGAFFGIKAQKSRVGEVKRLNAVKKSSQLTFESYAPAAFSKFNKSFEYQKKAMVNFKKSRNLLKGSMFGREALLAAGAMVAGYGVAKLIRSQSKKKNQPLTADAASIAGGAAVASFGLGSAMFGKKYAKFALKHYAKKLFGR